MKQTAVEWLFDNLNITGGSEDIKAFKQAKAMEKKQMKALYTMHLIDTRTMELYDFDEYYKQTYESKTNI